MNYKRKTLTTYLILNLLFFSGLNNSSATQTNPSLEGIPTELSMLIISRLSAADLVSMQLVARQFNNMIKHNEAGDAGSSICKNIKLSSLEKQVRDFCALPLTDLHSLKINDQDTILIAKKIINFETKLPLEIALEAKAKTYFFLYYCTQDSYQRSEYKAKFNQIYNDNPTLKNKLKIFSEKMTFPVSIPDHITFN